MVKGFLVLSEVSVLSKVILEDIVDIPLNVGTGAKDYITLNEGVVRPTLNPSLLIYDEGTNTIDVISIYESIVQE